MNARILAGMALVLGACGRPASTPEATPPRETAAGTVTAETTAPDATAAEPADATEAAPTGVAAEPPLVAEPPPTVWTNDLVPKPARDDAGARAFVAQVAADGLAAHVDPELGVVWDDAGGRRSLARDALGDVSPALQRAIRDGAAGLRCRGGQCLVEAGEDRWFLLVRRTSAPGRFVAGVLHVRGWPSAHRYAAWAAETRATWQAAAPSLIGDGLSSEEAGYHDRAYAQFTKAYASAPDNPWPLYYMARIRVVMKQYREAYVDYRRLAEHPSPVAVRAQLKVDTDEEMARFRTHSAVKAVQAELELPAPTAPEAFAQWLRRFRAVEERLAPVIAEGGPTPSAVAELLEAHLLDTTAATEARIAWTGAALTLRRNALGALEITGIEASPGSAPPE